MPEAIENRRIARNDNRGGNVGVALLERPNNNVIVKEPKESEEVNKANSIEGEPQGFSDISPEIIANMFREYLIHERNYEADVADEISVDLVDFINKKVPEIGAIGVLRELAKPLDKNKYPLFPPDKERQGVDPKKWYARFYENDVRKGRINTNKMSQLDSPFTQVLKRTLVNEGTTLGHFMKLEEVPPLKVQAMSVVLDAPMEATKSFLYQLQGGRPAR